MKLKPEFFNIERPIKISEEKTYIFYESRSDQHDRVYVPQSEKDFNEFIDVLLVLTKNPTEKELENYSLIKKYPFIFIKNRWDGGIYLYEDRDISTFNRWFDSTEIDWVLNLDKERTMRFLNDLTNHFDSVDLEFKYQYTITDIKEKYNTLRWYDAGNTTEGYKMVDKYCSDMESHLK